jgi:hypothetical protein
MLKDSPWAKQLEERGGGGLGSSPNRIGPGNFPDAGRGSTGSFGRDVAGGEGALARSGHYYIIAVSGLPPGMKDPKAALEIPGKDPIESVDVKAVGDGQTVVLHFIFPRTPITVEDEGPTIPVPSG